MDQLQISLEGKQIESNCFGCSSINPVGLKLDFIEGVNEVYADFILSENFESYPGLLHGGIVATILDEAMGQAILAKSGNMGLTLGLRVRFNSICESNTLYRVVGQICKNDSQIIKTDATLLDANKDIVAYGEATFTEVSEEMVINEKVKIPKITRQYIKSVLKKREGNYGHYQK